MALEKTLNDDLKTAMKAHDKLALNVIRMIKASLTNERVKLGHDLTEDDELTVLSRELKQRKESRTEFADAGRQDLVDQLDAEIELVEKYAPKQLSEEEVQQIVEATATEVNASSMADFGKMMGAVMPKLKGKADGAIVNKAVKALLSK
ncbi:GatB/YqeY domain-containing protein [Secundilactobacillus kimchicus]|uniref:GatB YqeY domain-containing protein n=1 Tax=Secundilactobacillus kimchicus JCM 15530 TaxID=1302272 RepID=A0A0R1HSJ2_9LACO|nr:GatB/YqeY domain-containing protein [Secundilactobacillus kimchicus]KRK49404.1 GatB YqeY domain-containing protein [Secundilactobacillus kimchicus JCM 15530]MBT9672950.1 GatB/YqeY domain-containing protein [Secundilactobacillus kimchicus]